ncbi:MAG: peptidylprolyl isomerase [Endomicrobium sp.]|jgi:parvulin-like peptidyl-prolyl isomerase|nr:peptidylprolyl isomerase [Endomicrobium sp.]
MNKVFFAIVVSITAFNLSSCNKDSRIVAKIGGVKITETVLNEKLASMPPEYQNYINKPSGRKQLIDALVREAVVVESAKKSGVDKRVEYKNAVKEFASEQKKQFIEYKKSLLIGTYIKEVHKSIHFADEDIKAYYNKNIELFDKPMGYTIRHILVSDLQTAKNAYERLQKGENFAKVAKEVSKDDTSALNGGLIGSLKRGELVPEVEQVVLSLKNNEMSGIFETPYGYHIIFKISENRLPPISFDKAREIIKGTLEREKFNNWFTQEKQNLGVKINYDIPNY